MELSVILPTFNPHAGRLQRTLAGLRGQLLPVARWETIVVNNASSVFPPLADLKAGGPGNLSVVDEPVSGLTAARQRGFRAARGAIAVLADDDNVLAPDYLTQVLALFSKHPAVGLAGGRSLPEFERPPADWEREFLPLLALRDLGPEAIVSRGLRPAGAAGNVYPAFAPIGAGMALRRAAWEAWLRSLGKSGIALSDRRGGELTSSGDNDIVLCAMKAGWEAGYFPELSLTHPIPAGRLDARYLARLNRGIQKSWMQVLTLHEASPWGPLSTSGAAFRKARSWITHRAWSSSAAHIRWQGACGHFDGRVPVR